MGLKQIQKDGIFRIILTDKCLQRFSARERVKGIRTQVTEIIMGESSKFK